MNIIIGSARISEKGTVAGNAGDQKQKTTPDYSGEVSMQKFYKHTLGWYVLRAVNVNVPAKLSEAMRKYCNDKKIGYSQKERNAIMKYDGRTNTNCDCSSLVRRCIRDATNVTLADFTTAGEANALVNSGMFKNIGKYRDGMKLYTGDVLVTCTKGHTAIVIEGYARAKTFPKYSGKLTGIDEIFKVIGATAYYDKTVTGARKRAPIARANGIGNYSGTEGQNIKLKTLARNGQLLVP